LIIGTVIVTSLILLAAKELTKINDTWYSVRLSKLLNVPIIIMVALFIVLVAIGIMGILRTAPL